MEGYMQETKKAYDLYALQFDEKFGDYFKEYVVREAQQFLHHLPGPKIIDLGSGPGNHAFFFHQQGYKVLCLDISERMVALCKQKGLPAEVMDIEKISLSPES